jgi:outer membrane protein OmpA-like peptidoglycan-associated protein
LWKESFSDKLRIIMFLLEYPIMVPRSSSCILIIKFAVILSLGGAITVKTTEAEETVIIGNNYGQSVETNYSVLNSLQGSRNLPDLLLGGKNQNHNNLINDKSSYFPSKVPSASKTRQLRQIEPAVPNKPLLKLSPSFFSLSTIQSKSAIKIPKKPVLIPVKIAPISPPRHHNKLLETKKQPGIRDKNKSPRQIIKNNEPNSVKAQFKTKNNQVRMLFNSQEKVPLKAELLKLQKIIHTMGADDSLRIQLIAYASRPGGSPSKARRLSLSRALSIRSLLINNGIDSDKMSIKALGNRIGTGPSNRVDIVLLK